MPSAQKICKLHFLRNNVIQCHIVSTLRLVHTRAANMLQPAIASRCKKLKLFSHTALHHCTALQCTAPLQIRSDQ